jgi:molybdate transport system ATP-binding protein
MLTAGPATVSVDVGLRRADFELDVSFELLPGQTLAVVGPNGAGKSTLLDAIAGHATIDRGHIRIDDITMASTGTGGDVSIPAERRPLSLVRQDPLLFPHLSVIDNVEFGLRATGVDKEQRRARAMAALEAVDLANSPDTAVHELSGGQAQRASLARALVLERPVLLLDEPLSRVDVTNRRLIREVLDQVSATQIIVTHGRDHARDCDRILAIDHGQIVADTTPEVLVSDPPTEWLAELLA